MRKVFLFSWQKHIRATSDILVVFHPSVNVYCNVI